MNIEESATRLSRNPLGIIALFILLIYGFATLLFGFVGDIFTEAQKWWFVIFLVIFPVLVLFVFAYLVINHHQKLYAPGDYRDEKNFFGNISPKEQEEKFEQEVKLEQESISSNANNQKQVASNKEQLNHSLSEFREKIEYLENLVFDYYEKTYNYDFDRNVYFNVNERRISFDGVAERKGILNFFEIKYLSNIHINSVMLDKTVLDAINVQNYMIKNGKFPNYRYRLKLIFIIDSEKISEKTELAKKIRNLIDTEVINISVTVFTVKQLENKLLKFK